jgi:putative transposase
MSIVRQGASRSPTHNAVDPFHKAAGALGLRRYTAGETIDFAVAVNLVAYFTPVSSPVSNGVCEAFVMAFKRDYVRVNPRPDAVSVLQRLAEWFEDHNTVHPHSGLRMRSPREFIASQSATHAACPV